MEERREEGREDRQEYTRGTHVSNILLSSLIRSPPPDLAESTPYEQEWGAGRRRELPYGEGSGSRRQAREERKSNRGEGRECEGGGWEGRKGGLGCSSRSGREEKETNTVDPEEGIHSRDEGIHSRDEGIHNKDERIHRSEEGIHSSDERIHNSDERIHNRDEEPRRGLQDPMEAVYQPSSADLALLTSPTSVPCVTTDPLVTTLPRVTTDLLVNLIPSSPPPLSHQSSSVSRSKSPPSQTSALKQLSWVNDRQGSRQTRYFAIFVKEWLTLVIC